MSPDKLVDENDPSTWVAKTKVAPVKFTKWFLFYIQSQVPSRKTSNFPATEAIRNVDYRRSSILKLSLLLFKDQLSFVAVYETTCGRNHSEPLVVGGNN